MTIARRGLIRVRTLFSPAPLLAIFLLAGCSDNSNDSKKVEWLFVNYTAYNHNIHISVNGEKHALLDYGSGFDTKPSPLKEGKNDIFVRFVHKPDKDDEHTIDSKARIFLSPTMMVGEKPLPGIMIEDVSGYCECRIGVTIKDKTPQTIGYTREEWATENKAVLRYEETVSTGAFSEIYDKTTYKIWSSEGKPFSEETYNKGKLDMARYYRPDGTIGAEVNGGKGFYRQWQEDGNIASEVPVSNGVWHGVMKEFSEGKVVSEIRYEHGEEVIEE